MPLDTAELIKAGAFIIGGLLGNALNEGIFRPFIGVRGIRNQHATSQENDGAKYLNECI